MADKIKPRPKEIIDAVADVMAENGRRGGKSTLKRHGKDHFRRAAVARWSKPALEPAETSPGK